MAYETPGYAKEVETVLGSTVSGMCKINKIILETNHKVNPGSELVKKTANSLRKIIENVKSIEVLMENIAQSPQELNGISNNVKIDVEAVNKMSEEIFIMVEEQIQE